MHLHGPTGPYLHSARGDQVSVGVREVGNVCARGPFNSEKLRQMRKISDNNFWELGFKNQIPKSFRR